MSLPFIYFLSYSYSIILILFDVIWVNRFYYLRFSFLDLKLFVILKKKSDDLLCFRAPRRGGDSWVEKRMSKGPVVAEPVDLGVGEKGSL